MNNDHLKQYLLIGLILALVFVLGGYVYSFFPGILGAITLYILMRKYYFRLTVIKNWKKGLTAVLFLFIGMAIFTLPFIFLVQVLIPKFTEYLTTGQLNDMLTTLTTKLRLFAPRLMIDEKQVLGFASNFTSSATYILNSTMNMLVNAFLAFFLLYFMLVDGRKMEMALQKYIPMEDQNIDEIWKATHLVVKANAIGIPILAICQGIVAMIGYYMFGISSYVLWGAITGICSVLPVLGTALVWAPLSLYLIASGNTPAGLGLAAYSFFITGSIDNILRFTLLRRLGDVHPVITVIGIIAGVPLFGFMGFIFGPLLVSYLLLLIRIYRAEFSLNG
jgi:predicted PurR-regulated permease PerM